MQARRLDGFINRELEGAVIETVEKDDYRLIFHCANGERWAVSWVTPNGEAIKGEPMLERWLFPKDGHIHKALAGQTVESIRSDGRTLIVQCSFWRFRRITWTGGGEPCLMKVDVVVTLPSVDVFGTAGEIYG